MTDRTHSQPSTTEAEASIYTFGCRLNAYESEVMRHHIAAAGLTDVVLFNSCAVTAEAERQLRQAIRKVRRSRPEARIVITGCAAQIHARRYAAMEEVDLVIGNHEKLAAGTWQRLAAYPLARRHLPGQPEAQQWVGDIMAARETAHHLLPGFDQRSRAFLQIQQGCDHRCTFCIIPYGRGPSRSTPASEVIQAARHLMEHGAKEIVLTGVDLTAYGHDFGEQDALGRLVKAILNALPELPRLRLSSLDAVEIDPVLMHALADEPRLMPHLHLSLQSGDDLILKRMKRRHLRADAIALTQTLREARPDIIFGADMIAGFPTEDEAMFQRSLDLVEECGLTYLHVFPFSPREGTPAARMPQLPPELRRQRAEILRAKGKAVQMAYFDSLIGRPLDLLIEKTEDSRAFGHSAQFAPLWVENAMAAPGDLIAVQATRAEYPHLLARRIR